MTAPDISQFELADPAPAGQLIPAPAAARTAAGQSLSSLSAGRRPEFDVMRGFVVAGLVVFRSAVAFASGASRFVTDPRPSRGFTVFLLWGSLRGMPLLFLISGMGARYAMRTRSAAASARARLLIPFAFGLVLLVPPMFYIEGPGRHGAELVVHGRDAGRGSAVAGTITAAGGKARFVASDLTDPAQLDHVAGQAGPVDVLVNNAGFSWFGPTAELDVATFDRLFAANVQAAYFLVAALAPKMAAQGSGSIINIGSMAGQIGLADGAAYGATKATLAAMTRSLGGRVQSLRCPGQCHRCRAGPDQRGPLPAASRPSAPRPCWPGPPSPARSPGSSPSSPPRRPATSPGRSSPLTGAAPPSDPGGPAGTAPDPGRHSVRHVSPGAVRASPSGRPHSRRPFVKGNTGMSTSLVAIGIDCAEAPAVARFWADVLGRQVAEDSTSERVILLPGDGDTFDAETERLQSLGAHRLRDLQRDKSRRTSFADIEGDEFDLIAG